MRKQDTLIVFIESKKNKIGNAKNKGASRPGGSKREHAVSALRAL